jgi:hypothetical protein
VNRDIETVPSNGSQSNDAARISHMEWVEGVETACAWVECFNAPGSRVRAVRSVLRTRPVSWLGRTVGYTLWRLAQ